jgi:hypothetical protein
MFKENMKRPGLAIIYGSSSSFLRAAPQRKYFCALA